MKNLNLVAQHAASAENVWGKAYDELWPLINAKKLRTGVEIGVAFGGHSERILGKTKCKLYSIDPYKHFPDYDDPMNMSDKEFQDLYLFTRKRLSKFGNRSRLLRTSSQDAIKKVRNPVDFVYLDGDHSYDGVLYDISHWFNKLSHGGVIAGHDYGHPSFPGVKTIVDQYFGRLGLKVNKNKNSVWWVEKRLVNISYIVPAYNCSNTIKESIESIRSQNLEEGDEIIIVDDNSTDNTLEVVQGLAKKNKKLKVIRQLINKGGGATRNLAIKHAKNNLIFCLDSDNVLVKNTVNKLQEFLFTNLVDGACFSEVKFIDSNKHQRLSWKYEKTNYGLLDHLFLNELPSSSGNYLYTKKAWKSVGGYPEKAHALDTWAFGLRLAANSFKIQVYPKFYYYHRLDLNSYWNRTVNKYNYVKIASEEMSKYYDKMPLLFQLYFKVRFNEYNWFAQLGKKNIFSLIHRKLYLKGII